MKLSFSFFISFLFIPFTIFSQIRFSNIPDSLKKNANAIVRYNYSEFDVSNSRSAKYKVKYAVTILNKNGDEFSNLYCFYDKFRKIEYINGNVYDDKGVLIRKIKSKDFTDQSISGNGTLYDDSRIRYFEVYLNKYPYTVEYEYEISYNGFIQFPKWTPVDSYNESVEKSEYLLKINNDVEFKFRTQNLNQAPEIEKNSDYTTYKWSVENLAAIINEPYSPFISEHTPNIIFAPNNFIYDGVPGNQTSWKDIGSWVFSLSLNRDKITDKTKNEIHRLVENIDSEIEKTKVLYEYMQSKTRYVSIQLGIGGYQPFTALEVDELGYGDCKALSNYMVAILKEAGITSYYSIIKAGNNTKKIFTDFSSIGQMNHAIVCVPYNMDTIWLECTNQNIPFGYLGPFTDNRYALLIKPDGGELVKTKRYFQADNTQRRTITAKLNNDCSLTAQVNTEYKALQYDNISYQFYESTEDQKKNLYKNLDLVNFNIKDFKYSQEKNVIPKANEYLDLELNNYATISGKRMFLPLDLLNKSDYIPSKLKNRETEILLNFAYSDIDTITYLIPEKYNIEFISDSTQIKTQFGEYKSFISVDDNILTYVRINKRNEGRFPAECYNDFIEFYKAIKKADNCKAILIEKN